MRLTEKDKMARYGYKYVAPDRFDNFGEGCNKLGQLEDLLEEFNINDINELRTCLENEQKGTEFFENWWNERFEALVKPKVEALKIIKEKDVNPIDIRCCDTVEQYNVKENGFARLTKDEFDLLKEELL